MIVPQSALHAAAIFVSLIACASGMTNTEWLIRLKSHLSRKGDNNAGNNNCIRGDTGIVLFSCQLLRSLQDISLRGCRNQVVLGVLAIVIALGGYR